MTPPSIRIVMRCLQKTRSGSALCCREALSTRLLCKGIVEVFLLRDIPLAQQPAQEMDEEHLIFICKPPPVALHRVWRHGLYRRFRAWYEGTGMVFVDWAASPRADASSSFMFGQRGRGVDIV